MPDLNSQDAAVWLETEGALLDGLVSETTADDWQAVIDMIRSVGWWYDYVQDGSSRRLPGRAREIFTLRMDHALVLHVRPERHATVNFHFFDPATIDFDLDPKELQTQAAVNTLCEVVRRIGRKLGKPVILGNEGTLPQRPTPLTTLARSVFTRTPRDGV